MNPITLIIDGILDLTYRSFRVVLKYLILVHVHGGRGSRRDTENVVQTCTFPVSHSFHLLTSDFPRVKLRLRQARQSGKGRGLHASHSQFWDNLLQPMCRRSAFAIVAIEMKVRRANMHGEAIKHVQGVQSCNICFWRFQTRRNPEKREK